MASPVPASERRAPIALVAAVSVGLAVAGGVLWWRARDNGGTAAPKARPAAPARAAISGGRSEPDGVAERNRRLTRAPAALPSHEAGAKVYADAVAAGEPHPGEKAFRADAVAFFEFNGDLGEEKAAKEGITLDELKELTFMGLVAMHVRRWDDVARVTQRELTDEQRARGDELVFSASNALKAAIRAHVAKGDSPEARWETIRKHQASFVERYRALVGISEDDYDRLLAQPFLPAGG